MIDNYIEENYEEFFALGDWNFRRKNNGFGDKLDVYLKIPRDAMRAGILKACHMINKWLIEKS